MLIKLTEATRSQLNWLVAKAEGGYNETSLFVLKAHLEALGPDALWNELCVNTPGAMDASIMSNEEMVAYGLRTWRAPNYSTDWVWGGPIIEREKISIRQWANVPIVHAYMPGEGAGWSSDGEYPLIAAMRCYVASKLGDDVEVPDDLV